MKSINELISAIDIIDHLITFIEDKVVLEGEDVDVTREIIDPLEKSIINIILYIEITYDYYTVTNFLIKKDKYNIDNIKEFIYFVKEKITDYEHINCGYKYDLIVLIPGNILELLFIEYNKINTNI